MEVKTDYDFSGCRMEWKIQLNAQMLCANLPWGVIVCFDGVKGKLHAWYFRRDKALCEMIEKATNQFWIIVDDPDDSYPEPEKNTNNDFPLGFNDFTQQLDHLAVTLGHGR